METFVFQLEGMWKGSWDGNGRIETKGLNSSISVDPSMQGSGIGTNPDELLLSALSSCFLITLGIRLNKESISYDHISIRSEGTVTKQGGLHFEKVVHKPVIYLNGALSDELRSKLFAAIKMAERDCMIAKAVRGNIRVDVEPVFQPAGTNLISEKA
ncbi:hypothetical protein E4665_13005 [Sporolactobacillus shoreae]|uniref:OsmC family peroxiredoxin n=1 Tax=Sporolactobacillus shoreae TaxID=1465501 RepID=A0A4Z0GM01_9BACL|nr:OsmC family protein [Sporolactobacillus shoreae]TGA97138.1 hypothetical protein E4665_13005 [Sporolactobacillus shoreae]